MRPSACHQNGLLIGPWSSVFGLRSLFCVWASVFGLLSLVFGLCHLVLFFALWYSVFGLWPLVFGLWISTFAEYSNSLIVCSICACSTASCDSGAGVELAGVEVTSAFVMLEESDFYRQFFSRNYYFHSKIISGVGLG